MQQNLSFIEDHAQGRLPLDTEQTAPTFANRKPFMTTKYAYSIKTSRIKEPDFPYGGQQLTCTSEVISFARSLQDSDIEKMLTLYLDAQNKLICIQVTNGTVNQAVVYPREIIRHALLANACAIILVHNHPSNNVRPSDPDIRLTKIIKESAKVLDILVHDHIIIGSEGRHLSFKEEGIL